MGGLGRHCGSVSQSHCPPLRATAPRCRRHHRSGRGGAGCAAQPGSGRRGTRRDGEADPRQPALPGGVPPAGAQRRRGRARERRRLGVRPGVALCAPFRQPHARVRRQAGRPTPVQHHRGGRHRSGGGRGRGQRGAPRHPHRQLRAGSPPLPRRWWRPGRGITGRAMGSTGRLRRPSPRPARRRHGHLPHAPHHGRVTCTRLRGTTVRLVKHGLHEELVSVSDFGLALLPAASSH